MIKSSLTQLILQVNVDGPEMKIRTSSPAVVKQPTYAQELDEREPLKNILICSRYNNHKAVNTRK
jgi:hypothetical protein